MTKITYKPSNGNLSITPNEKIEGRVGRDKIVLTKNNYKKLLDSNQIKKVDNFLKKKNMSW